MRSALLAFGVLATAAAVAQEPTALQQAIKDEGVHKAWVYNDLDAGFAQARKTGKPLLVVFR